MPPLRLFPKPRCVLVLVSGKNAEQVAVDQRAKRLGAVAVVAQAGSRKDARILASVLKPIERGKRGAIATVELAKSVKELGFCMRVRAAALKLRRGIGAYSFMNSHGLPDLLSGELRLGHVRCFCTGRRPLVVVCYFFFGFCVFGFVVADC